MNDVIRAARYKAGPCLTPLPGSGLTWNIFGKQHIAQYSESCCLYHPHVCKTVARLMKVQLNFLAWAVHGSSPFLTAPASPSCCGGTVMNAANITVGPTYLLCRHEAASDAHSHLTRRSSLDYGQLHLSENQQELFVPPLLLFFSLRAWSPDAAALVLLFSFLPWLQRIPLSSHGSIDGERNVAGTGTSPSLKYKTCKCHRGMKY